MSETAENIIDATDKLPENEEEQSVTVTFSNGVTATVEQVEAALAQYEQTVKQLQALLEKKDRQVDTLIAAMEKGT